MSESKPIRILYMEDDEGVAYVISKKLKQSGFDIEIAINGEEGLEKYENGQFDLLLVDHIMPVLGGMEVIQILASKGDPCPIIMVTGTGDERSAVKALKSGASDYVIKDFEGRFIELMPAAIDQALAKRRMINEKNAAEAKIKHYVVELEKSNKQLQNFASTISHDLRGPLISLIRFLAIIKEDFGQYFDERGEECFRRSLAITGRMTDLIDSLLEFSQIKNTPPSFKPIDLNKIITQVLVNLDNQIKETQGKIYKEDLPIVEGNDILLLALFQNLIANSLKFHRKDLSPVIKLKAEKAENGRWEIIVEDNGIGFDQQYVEKIFQPFERLHSKSQFKGHGIGLANCKEIIHHHQGTITAQGKPGKGSTFHIVLPTKQNWDNPHY